MKLFKKIVSIICVLAVGTVLFTGCSGNNQSSKSANGSAISTTGKKRVLWTKLRPAERLLSVYSATKHHSVISILRATTRATTFILPIVLERT